MTNPARAAKSVCRCITTAVADSLAALPDIKWPDRCAWPLIAVAVLYFGGHLLRYAVTH
jgi:hypothetical protein